MHVVYSEVHYNEKAASWLYAERYWIRSVPNCPLFASLRRNLCEDSAGTGMMQVVHERHVHQFRRRGIASSRWSFWYKHQRHCPLYFCSSTKCRAHFPKRKSCINITCKRSSHCKQKIILDSWNLHASTLTSANRILRFHSSFILRMKSFFCREGMFNQQNMYEWSHSNPSSCKQRAF